MYFFKNIVAKFNEINRAKYQIKQEKYFITDSCPLSSKRELSVEKKCQKIANHSVQCAQEPEKLFKESEVLIYLNALKMDCIKNTEVVGNNPDIQNKNCSTKCDECSYNDSKRRKVRDDGVYCQIRNDEMLNKSSSDEEAEELQNENKNVECCRAVSLDDLSRYRKLPIKNAISQGNDGSLNSLSEIKSAVLDIRNEIKMRFEQLEYSQDALTTTPDDILIPIVLYLSNEDIINLLFTTPIFVDRFAACRTILRLIDLNVDKENYRRYSQYFSNYQLPIISLNLNFEAIPNVKEFLPILDIFKNSIENLEIKNANFKNYTELSKFFINLPNLQKIILEKCAIENINNEKLPSIPNLSSISFNKCNDNIFKVFVNQKTLVKITVRNESWTWSGFPHDIFNQMATNVEKLLHIVFIGLGTGSFFDSDLFSFKVKNLETTLISFHWYVGIRNGRTSFLQSQKGFLKNLKIHQLPFDFDGGRVLKYIIEEMNLETFYYGKIPLILNGQKQQVQKFEANEIQIQSIFEMFTQFPTITSFCLNINETDIASDAIESIINRQTNLFDNLQEFEVVDNSKYRSTFGVFLGLLKNFRNIKKLTLRTQDRNINTLLGEFLPMMTRLTEIYLPSRAPRSAERFNIIKTFVPNLSKISVASQFIQEANDILGNNVQIVEIRDS